MSDTSREIINEYKDQLEYSNNQVDELEDQNKSKDSANKRCLQKLEYANDDLEKANKKLKELEENKTFKQTNEQL